MLKFLIIIALVLTGLKWGGVVTWSWAAIWGPAGAVIAVLLALLVLALIGFFLAVKYESRQRKRK